MGSNRAAAVGTAKKQRGFPRIADREESWGGQLSWLSGCPCCRVVVPQKYVRDARSCVCTLLFWLSGCRSAEIKVILIDHCNFSVSRKAQAEK